MSCTPDRWSCPGCRTVVVRQSGQAEGSWAATLRLVQEVHGRKHARRVPLTARKEDR